MRYTLCLVAITVLTYGVHAQFCPRVVPPLSGTTTFTGIPREGTTVTGLCQNGLIMSGPSTLTCINGRWVPAAFGACVAPPGGLPGGVGTAPCPPMVQPLGATLVYSSGTTSAALAGSQIHGTTVTLRCNNLNAIVSGPTTATCVNGVWQPSALGVCTVVSPTGTGDVVAGLSTNSPCGLGVVPPLNSQVIYSSSAPYPEGSTATMVCNPGFVVSGPSVVTCRGGAFGLLGTCVRIG
ncbi:hypothetical protein GCK32_003205 [Trichostrongylus colubriformis]|uniref:Sushi domain-containing protein n=1 Tax=Trichostrongylus colubriformis TaxID=6319 RepID=A0AAN8FKM6_TRICO